MRGERSRPMGPAERIRHPAVQVLRPARSIAAARPRDGIGLAVAHPELQQTTHHRGRRAQPAPGPPPGQTAPARVDACAGPRSESRPGSPSPALNAKEMSSMPQLARWTWVRAGETPRQYVRVGSTAASMPPTVPPTRPHVPRRGASQSFGVNDHAKPSLAGAGSLPSRIHWSVHQASGSRTPGSPHPSP